MEHQIVSVVPDADYLLDPYCVSQRMFLISPPASDLPTAKAPPLSPALSLFVSPSKPTIRTVKEMVN